MFAYVRLRLSDGTTHVLTSGDLIGRMQSAALHIDDVRISEAHAMVSLRGRELKLLALRGVFAVNAKPVREVVLHPGMRFQPARGMTVEVEEVVLPDTVLALEGDGLPRQILAGANSLIVRPRPSLDTRYRSDAAAWIHSVGDGWRLTIGAAPPRPLHPDQRFEVDGVAFRVMSVALESAANPSTRSEDTMLQPLHIIARFNTAHIRQGGETRLVLDGIPARIITELVAFAGPVAWDVVAKEIWPELTEKVLLRRRWDIALVRLRRKLRAAHIRADLVRSGGKGRIELLLHEGDSADEEG